MRAVALFHPKARQWVAGRSGLLNRLERELPLRIGEQPVAWFHAASLGEFEQGRPVIEAFRTRYPRHFIFLTFFSPSGYEVKKNYAVADFITYLPPDTSGNARRLVALLRPELAFFIKYEFWGNYLRVLRQHGTVIISFSAIFRPGQLFFQSYGKFYRRLLHHFDHILVQNAASAALLDSIGVDRVSVAGDTRFDRVRQIAAATRDLPEIAAFVAKRPCLVAGSVWEADRTVLAPALNSLDTLAVIAPHEIREADLRQWEQSLAAPTLRYSAYRASGFVLDAHHPPRYLLIDNIGMLSSLYRYGTAAYIGGAFGQGLHNILEAATFGLPIMFGNKNYEKFQEARDLIEIGSATAVEDTATLRQVLTELIDDSARRVERGNQARAYVERQAGATAVVMRIVERLMTPKIS